MTIKDFFVKLVLTKELSPECSINIAASEVIERVELSEVPVSAATQISPDCDIIELTSSIGVHIHYQLKNDTRIIPDLIPKRNSFMIMMQNAHRIQLYLLTFSQSENPNRKQILRCDLVDWIHLHNERWSTQSLADTQDKQFIVSLVEAIWYIDMCNYENSKSIIITYLSFFMSFSVMQIQNYTSNPKNPLMQMNSICIVKFLPLILHHHGC
jgi:hypothetical protein